MMLWARWIELYCIAVAELMCGELEPRPLGQPDRNVIDMSEERAKRRRQTMRAL